MYQIQVVIPVDPSVYAKFLIGGSSTNKLTICSTLSYGTGTLLDPHEPDGHGTQLVEGSRGNATAQRHSVGKLRSKLWKEFEILEFDQTNGAPVRAKCIHCGTVLGCPTKQGTGVLQNHLKSKACLYKKCEGSNPLRYPTKFYALLDRHIFKILILYICLKAH
jgi:hypothetical protein